MKLKDKPCILIIEDDIKLAEGLSANLIKENYSVSRASKVADALWKLRNQKFAAILLDVNLEQGVSGEDILAQIRDNKKECNYTTPVVVVSGYLSKALVVRLGPISNVSALVKPFKMQQLLDKLRAVILGEASDELLPTTDKKINPVASHQDEARFLHDISSPLATAMFISDSMSDGKPDLEQLEELKKSLVKVSELLSARKNIVGKM